MHAACSCLKIADVGRHWLMAAAGCAHETEYGARAKALLGTVGLESFGQKQSWQRHAAARQSLPGADSRAGPPRCSTSLSAPQRPRGTPSYDLELCGASQFRQAKRDRVVAIRRLREEPPCA